MIKRIALILLIFYGILTHLTAQQIENIKFHVSGESIIITYDFTGTQSNQLFDIVH